METNVERTKTPGHGRSDVKGSLRIWKASSRGNPQELLEYVPLCAYVELEYSSPYCFGTASKYLTIRPSNPPTFTNPTNDNDPCNARRVVPREEGVVCTGFTYPLSPRQQNQSTLWWFVRCLWKWRRQDLLKIINRSNFSSNTGHKTNFC